MNSETKEVYSILQDIFKNVWEQQKYAEVKNSILLTFNIAVFLLLARLYFFITSAINNNIYYKSFFYILIVLLIIHIVLIIQSFFPKDSNKETLKRTIDEINIFFFGDIKKLRSEDYFEIVIQKIGVTGDINKQLLIDLSNQIVKLSEITQIKYTSFKNSVFRMYWLGLFFILYFTCLFLNIK